MLHAALRLELARLVLDDAGGLLKDLPAILGLLRKDFVDAPLSDQGIAVLADAGIPEEVDDVAQAAGGAVDLVLALAAAVDAPRDGDLGEVDRQRLVRIVEHERHLAEREAAALLGAVEDDVLHFRAAQRLGALLAEHPSDGVGDVRLAAAVRADDAGDAAVK